MACKPGFRQSFFLSLSFQLGCQTHSNGKLLLQQSSASSPKTFLSLGAVHPRVVANFAPFLLCLRALDGMTMTVMASAAPRVAVDGASDGQATSKRRQSKQQCSRVAGQRTVQACSLAISLVATMDACHRAVGLSDASIFPHISLASSRP